MGSDGAATIRTMFVGQAAVVASLIVLAVFGHLLLVWDFSSAVGDGAVINAAGRQRMLVQNISALKFDIALSSEPAERSRYRRDLEQALHELDGIHANLFGAQVTHPLSPETKALLREGSPSLEQSLRTFIDNEQAALDAPKATAELVAAHEAVNRIIVPGLDKVVKQLQAEAGAHTSRFYINVLIGDMALVMLLALSWVKIFHPMMNRLRNEIGNVERAKKLTESMVDAALDAIITIDHTGRIVTFNRSAELIFGYKKDDALGLDIADLIIPDEHRKAHLQGLERAASGYLGPIIGKRLELTAKAADGHFIPVELTVTHLAEQRLFTAFIRDQSEVREIRDSVEILRAAIEKTPLSVVITDLDGKIEYVNAAFTSISGYQKHEAIGNHTRALKSGLTLLSTYEELWSTLLEGKVWRGELINRRKDGSLFYENAVIFPVKNADGRTANFIAIKEDITRQKEYLARISDFETRDQVTGLPNRRCIYQTIVEKSKHGQEHDHGFAVCVLKVSTFSEVVQSFGHAVADTFITAVAERLSLAIRPTDILARTGGDTFIVVVSPIVSRAIAEAVANSLLGAFSHPFQCCGHEINGHGNIGISYCPDDGNDPDELVRHATTAAARAVEKGNDVFRVFVPDMDRQAIEERHLETELIRAIDNGDIQVHYQPLVSSADRGVVGAEALARWTSPTLGAVRPDRFIGLAEKRGLIRPLGAIVLETACTDAVRFCRQTSPSFVMAVNIAAQQIEEITFAEQVSRIIDERGLSPRCLEIEITERSLMSKSPHVSAQVDILRSIGHGLSIDDFGTGYSALSYLREYPFTTLKIDQSFVNQIGKDTAATSLVMAIVRMAQSLGLEIVAEGVETAEHVSFLSAAGVERLQGYYFAKPLSADGFLDWMQTYLRKADAV